MQTKPEQPTQAEDTVIDIHDLSVHFDLGGSTLARLFGRSTGTVKAVDGVNLKLQKGEVVGLVGESGSGKSTLGRSLLGLTPITTGSVRIRDDEIDEDISMLSRRRLRGLRRHVQMVFQDPNAALNPAMTVEQAMRDPLRIHKVPKSKRQDMVVDALERVGLSPVELFLTKYPRDLSGGQKQRVVIARAIIMGPSILVADEPISMLDMSVRAKILQLMLDLKAPARPQLRLHHPRPGQREVLLRPDRDHVPRPDRRARRHRGDLPRPEAPLHEGPAGGHPGSRPEPGEDARTC